MVDSESGKYHLETDDLGVPPISGFTSKWIHAVENTSKHLVWFGGYFMFWGRADDARGRLHWGCRKELKRYGPKESRRAEDHEREDRYDIGIHRVYDRIGQRSFLSFEKGVWFFHHLGICWELLTGQGQYPSCLSQKTLKFCLRYGNVNAFPYFPYNCFILFYIQEPPHFLGKCNL